MNETDEAGERPVLSLVGSARASEHGHGGESYFRPFIFFELFVVLLVMWSSLGITSLSASCGSSPPSSPFSVHFRVGYGGRRTRRNGCTSSIQTRSFIPRSCVPSPSSPHLRVPSAAVRPPDVRCSCIMHTCRSSFLRSTLSALSTIRPFIHTRPPR